jgi:hypothetical protein
MEGSALLFKYLGGSLPSARSISRTSPSPSAFAFSTPFAPRWRFRSGMTISRDFGDSTGGRFAECAEARGQGSPSRADRDGRDGAANVATYRLLVGNGVDREAIIACDSKGTLHKGRRDIEERQEILPDKWRV